MGIENLLRINAHPSLVDISHASLVGSWCSAAILMKTVIKR